MGLKAKVQKDWDRVVMENDAVLLDYGKKHTPSTYHAGQVRQNTYVKFSDLMMDFDGKVRVSTYLFRHHDE